MHTGASSLNFHFEIAEYTAAPGTPWALRVNEMVMLAATGEIADVNNPDETVTLVSPVIKTILN